MNGIVMRGVIAAFARALTARVTEEHNDEHRYHIKADTNAVNNASENRRVVFVGDCKNRVFTEKSAERRQPINASAPRRRWQK